MQIKVKSLPYILVVLKEPVSLKCQKGNNHLKIRNHEKVNQYFSSSFIIS